MPGKQITPHFNESELRCKCSCGRMEFSDAAVGYLEDLRVKFGKPMYLSSAYRCPEYNSLVSSTGPEGPHTQTEDDNITVDVLTFGADALWLVAYAIMQGFEGVGVSQKGGRGSRFVHLDRLGQTTKRPRPWLWSY